jgi:hypothetical protein
MSGRMRTTTLGEGNGENNGQSIKSIRSLGCVSRSVWGFFCFFFFSAAKRRQCEVGFEEEDKRKRSLPFLQSFDAPWKAGCRESPTATENVTKHVTTRRRSGSTTVPKRALCGFNAFFHTVCSGPSTSLAVRSTSIVIMPLRKQHHLRCPRPWISWYFLECHLSS